MSNAKKALEQVRALFEARYRLAKGDDSVGAAAIRAAIESDNPDIAELRRLLTEDYNLYPTYEQRVVALLDNIDGPASVEEAGDSGDAAPADSVKAISRMNKAELLALAEEREIEVDESATVADLRDMLREED